MPLFAQRFLAGCGCLRNLLASKQVFPIINQSITSELTAALYDRLSLKHVDKRLREHAEIDIVDTDLVKGVLHVRLECEDEERAGPRGGAGGGGGRGEEDEEDDEKAGTPARGREKRP